jgi:hypothetical protein
MEEMIAANRANSTALYRSDEDRINGLSAAGGLLKFLLE